MSFSRKIKRNITIQKRKEEYGRITCPKCHAKLVEKSGYDFVCVECGWAKPKGEEK